MKIREDIITARTNPTVKWAASLSEKKYRDASGVFIAEGEKLTYEAISTGLNVTHIFISESRYAKCFDLPKKALSDKKYENTEIVRLSDDVFGKISTEKSPQGVISVIKHLDFFRKLDIIYKEEFFLNANERALALCSVRDPGNLGSVIRSAVAFGVDHIILSSDCADLYNPKTVRSAMGSLFKVKATVVGNVEEFTRIARECGRRVFAAELTERAVSLSDLELKDTDIFMIGNEGHGIPKSVSDVATGSVYIPISARTESLNASVAAAVFMWEQNKL